MNIIEKFLKFVVMTLEVPRQVHQKVTKTENRLENVSFVLIFLIKLVVMHFVTAVIHESAHLLTCIAFGGEVSQSKLVFLGISATWEHIDGIKGSIVALSGACSVSLLSLCIYRPLFKKSKTLFVRQFFLIGIVQLSQEMFYWVFGSFLGGIPFPWRETSISIDPVYLANSLSIGSFVFVIGIVFLPLWLLTRKLNKIVMNEYVSIVKIHSEWKNKIIINFTKAYIILFQILNIITFVL